MTAGPGEKGCVGQEEGQGEGDLGERVQGYLSSLPGLLQGQTGCFLFGDTFRGYI